MKFKIASAPFPDQKMWSATSETCSYIIVQNGNGLYTVSARRFGSYTEFLIPYSAAVMTFEEAQAACLKHLARR